MKIKFAACLLLLAEVVTLGVRQASPQTIKDVAPCRIGRDAAQIGFWTWPTNTRVKVYIVSSDFTPDQVTYLLGALKTWSSVSEMTRSGVKFEYEGDTERQLTCPNCLTILRGAVFSKAKRHATELRAFSLRNDQFINYAAIVVDPSLTNPKALRDAIAHELGHNLGLLDCYTCKRKSTVMNQLKSWNAPNDLEGPTACDIAQVKLAYEELKVRVRPSPRGLSAEDEGEEPEDDDTPIVIPKP
jgi:hypothetical protein